MEQLDIPQLVRDLENAGVSDTEIAIRSQVGKSAVYAWKMGLKRPSLDAGLRFLVVHLEFFRKSSPLRTIVSASLRGKSI